jgi:cell division protease FtsH
MARQMGEMANYSQEVAAKIDTEIKKIIESSFEEAKKILIEKRALLDKISELLLQKETIDGEEFAGLLK